MKSAAAWLKTMAGVWKKGGPIWVPRLMGLQISRKTAECLQESSAWPFAVDFMLVHNGAPAEMERVKTWRRRLGALNLSARLIAYSCLNENHLRLAGAFVSASSEPWPEDFARKAAKLNKTLFSASDFDMETGDPAARLHPSILFIVSSLNISGGLYVILKHASILRRLGWEVTILDHGVGRDLWHEFEGQIFPVLRWPWQIRRAFDRVAATDWSTVALAENCRRAMEKCYLVQNYEPGFYPENSRRRLLAECTYRPRFPITPLTISQWCRRWLQDDYGLSARYAPNGLDLKKFHPVPRDFSGRLVVLIEGDSASPHKNVAESFAVAANLEPDLFEIHYLSYKGEPRPGWRVDRFHHRVPFDRVADVYRGAHILLKSSLLESFSYPPLEMMATGGLVVAVPNGGNAEYLKDGVNCLLYPAGDIERAEKAIRTLAVDQGLRDKLMAGGIKTAEGRAWENFYDDIIALYNSG